MIKSGQIYQNKKRGVKYAVYSSRNPESPFSDAILVTYSQRPNRIETGYFMKGDELIASYPSYQEAIKSPEFTGGK